MAARTTPANRIRELLDEVADPEIPVLTIADLGILRDVRVDAGGRIEVTITPTYSGCPALDVIRAEIVERLTAAGHTDVEVRTVLSPAWTTDWISEQGKAKLRSYGISPPAGGAAPRLPPEGVVPGSAQLLPVVTGPDEPVQCPQCGSLDTRLVSRFGSTACKALYRCDTCLEPFDHFKAI